MNYMIWMLGLLLNMTTQCKMLCIEWVATYAGLLTYA